jgi:hypothetical protein
MLLMMKPASSGCLNMRDLMLAAPDQTLDEISRKDYFALHCFTDRQDAANELAKDKIFPLVFK